MLMAELLSEWKEKNKTKNGLDYNFQSMKMEEYLKQNKTRKKDDGNMRRKNEGRIERWLVIVIGVKKNGLNDALFVLS